MQAILTWLNANKSNICFALSGIVGILQKDGVSVPPCIGEILVFVGGLTWSHSTGVAANATLLKARLH
jgi:hypothetical protein